MQNVVGTLGTCLYQYPATTKLSLAIILIKNEIYVYVTIVVVNSAASKIVHTVDISCEFKKFYFRF